MSMELIAVLSGSDLPDMRQWQTALASLGLPWRFEVSSNPAAAGGFCPMRAGKVVSGVEILNDTLDVLPGHPSIDGLHRVIAFRWSGDMLESACAFAAAAALTEACGAAIHDSSEDHTRIDSSCLSTTAAEMTARALREDSQALTVQKVVRAITKMPEMDWRFVIDGRIICRSIEGPYLRGIHVDRTSSPGVYKLRAMQTLWCMVEKTIYMNHSIELRPWLSGGLDRIVDGLRQELANDDGVRRCVMAGSGEPFLTDPRFGSGQESGILFHWIERVIMRALDGDAVGALPLLRRATELFPQLTSSTSDHRLSVVPAIIARIEQGGNVMTLLHPLADEAKARVTIKPVHSNRPVTPGAAWKAR